MEKLKKRLKAQKGFTLMEMLIVVAIIVILIAISIPIFSGQLEGARVATDRANERAAKAAAIATYLAKTDADGGTIDFSGGQEYHYDAINGTLVETSIAPEGYGQCTDATSSHSGGYIIVEISSAGEVNLSWSAGVTDTHNP